MPWPSAFIAHEPYLLHILHINGKLSFGILKERTSRVNVSIASLNLQLKSVYSNLQPLDNLNAVRGPQTSYSFNEISFYIKQ
jgi:hypothetical protein